MPAATSALARAVTSSRNCPAVTSSHRPSPLRLRIITACGSWLARVKTMSARLAVAGMSTRAGMLYSRTAPPS